MGLIDKIMPKRYDEAFEVAAGVVADGGLAEIDIPQSEKDKHGFFNILNVVNDSGQNIALMPNGIAKKQYIVPTKIDKWFTDINYTTLTLKNLSTTDATDGIIYVWVQKELGTREFLITLYMLLKNMVVKE